ncbi:MAG: hypothetical protein KDA71_04580, partial [Planctomycetales bacterium]|nr:hypothetical protein [Planctomycetales bacterium]
LLVLATPVRSATLSVRTEDASTVPLLPTVVRILIVASVGSATVWCSTNVLSDDTPRVTEPAPAEANPADDGTVRETPARRPTPFRVYIPLDEDGQPTNDYVYLPRPFYDALAKQAAATPDSERGFQIVSADYEGQLTRRVDDESLNVSALTATYRIMTFAAGAEIVLPLRRAQTSVTALQLDGLPVSINWDAEANSITVNADQPGEHRLEVFMQPRMQSDEVTAGIELAVPAAARARLSLSHPGDVPELRFPSAIGSVTRRLEIGETQVELGAASRLAIQWPLPKAEPKMPTELSADQYVWLQVRPTSVLVEARVTFRTSGAPIRVVQMRVDPRLNPLPLDEDSPVVDQRVTEGDPRQMRLLLDRDYEREVSLRLQFLWEPAAGEAEFHSLSLPRISPVVKQVGRYWLAASLPTGMVTSEPVDDAIEPLDPDSFAASWGEANSSPTLAFALAGMDVPISLPLRRQATPILADQQLDISINARAMELTYRAQLNAVSLDRFQYRFDVPRGLEIQSAIVRSDVTQRVRPALDGEGHLTIFLSERLRGEAVIQLVGTLPTPLGKTFETPSIRLLDVSTAGHRTRVYRQSDVSVQSQPAMEFAADSAVAWHAKLGRMVLDWVAPADQASEEDDATEAVDANTPTASNPTASNPTAATPSATKSSSPDAAIEAAAPPMLRVTQNQPRVRARMVTELAPLDDAWQASLEVLVDVAGGFIDQLRLEVPPQWSDVAAVDAPGVAIESRMAAGQSRGQIVIRPAEPIRGEFRLRLRGDLPATSVDIVLVPDATLLGVTSVDRYVILPTDLQRKLISWEISGLRETELPDDYVFAHEQLKSHGSYQVIGQTFQAKIAHVERTQSAAQVRLADIAVRWKPDGEWFGSAAYDLEPAGRKQCAFQAPADCRIINAVVDDLPVRVIPQPTGGFAIPLGSRDLPQRIEIVFTCDGQWQGKMERSTSFVAPMPIDIPVERTLWTVIGEPSDMARRPQLPGAVSAVRQEAYRLESVSSLIDLAADVAAESGGAELDNWYRRWSQRLARSQSRLDRWASASTLDPTSSTNAADAANAANSANSADTFDLSTFLEMVRTKQNAISERLRVGEATEPQETHGHWVDLTDVTLTACGLAELEESDAPSTATVARAMFVGARERMEFRYESRAVSQFWQRVALMLVIGGLLLTLAMLRSHVPLGEWCARWPYLFGVLAGLAWWLWLPPSFLGWVIVAISMIGAVRLPAASQRWPRVTEHGTTVIRNGG